MILIQRKRKIKADEIRKRKARKIREGKTRKGKITKIDKFIKRQEIFYKNNYQKKEKIIIILNKGKGK